MIPKRIDLDTIAACKLDVEPVFLRALNKDGVVSELIHANPVGCGADVECVIIGRADRDAVAACCIYVDAVACRGKDAQTISATA